GVLGEQERDERDAESALRVIDVNFRAAVSLGIPVAQRLRAQGHGTIVVLSSVAGERARRDNFVYGASKAGLDAFFQGLADSLVGSGVQVVVVRPGFVHTRMTAGRPPAPFSTTPDRVAADIVRGVGRGSVTVWSPGVLRPVMAALRTVAAFDFDGTLTRHDTLVPFLMRVRGRLPVLRAMLATAPGMARAALDGDARHAAKEALLIATLGGWWLDELRPYAADYARHLVASELRPDRLARLRWHREQGHEVVLVSASPELYVAPTAELLGCAATLATRLEVDRRDRLTGRIFEANVR